MEVTTMKTFSFRTKDCFRVDVLATTPRAGYNKLKAVPHLAEKITTSYLAYDKDGLASIHSWQTLESE
jgi:hypothetical protein